MAGDETRHKQVTSEPTIFALASGAGRAAIAVVRISGSRTGNAVEHLVGRRPEPRHATLAALRDPGTGEMIDRALVLWFPAPASFTGEDSAEFHLHGGRAVVAGVMRALSAMEGFRIAEPGEFTRRAFRNGKMDLTAVEGLADLIEAQTEGQRRQALFHLEGSLGIWAGKLRHALLAVLALAEGAIDFSEEDDVVASFRYEIGERAADVLTTITEQLRTSPAAEKLRDGLVVAIAGPTNAGKSSLLNALAGREVAIVSAQAGTTRDVIEVELELAGCPVVVVDTAGLRDTQDSVELEGIARARARAAGADLVLWLDDAGSGERPALVSRGDLWTVRTKLDLRRGEAPGAEFGISARTGEGLDGLIAALQAFASERLSGGETALVTRLRHRVALEEARRHLDSLLRGGGQDFELAAEDLRLAVAALSGLIGEIAAEDVLGSIFARFCIGK